MSGPMSAAIDKTEHRYQNLPYEKAVSSARWGLESNGLEITDLLNPDPKTTKLVGLRNKWGTIEVLIIDEKPDIIVRVKPFVSKKGAEVDFLSGFWEKFDAEAGIQKMDALAELEALRQGDFRTYHIENQKAMDLLVDQARWGLESMGMKILESLRPDIYTAAIVGSGKINKVKTDARVRIKGAQNYAVVQLLTSKNALQFIGPFAPAPYDAIKSAKQLVNEVNTFWAQLKLKFGESIEEELLKTAAVSQRSAEDQAAIDTLTDVWNKISQKDKELGSLVSNTESDPARIETLVGPLIPHIRDFLPWPVVPVLQLALQPARGRSAPYLVELSYIHVEEVPAHPAIFTFARLGPNPISKELQITDKFLFTYQGMDFTDEMGRHLNNEEPLLAKYLRTAYWDDSLAHYHAELNVKDKDGSKYSKVLDYILKDPVRIFNIIVGDSEQMVIIARAFLSPDGKVAPMPSAFQRLLDMLVVNLDRYCTKRPSASTPEGGVSAQPAVQVALNRCPFCNWLLTPGKTICPMCRKELPQREADFIPPPPPPKPLEGDLLQAKIAEPPSLATSAPSNASGICPQCNYSNPPGSTFCMQCGLKFQVTINTVSSPEVTQPQPSTGDAIAQRIQEINYQITSLQGVLNDLQTAFTGGSIKFEQYQASNDQYLAQISKLQEEKRALERKKFENEFKL